MIGKYGVRVNKICMECLTLGSQANKIEPRQMVDVAFDHIINFFDPVNSHSKMGLKRVRGGVGLVIE